MTAKLSGVFPLHEIFFFDKKKKTSALQVNASTSDTNVWEERRMVGETAKDIDVGVMVFFL